MNIIVNTQLGLLMERLFWSRVVAKVRLAVSSSQTGYIHRCEYHALAFHELAACRLGCGCGLWALMGDLVGAFPKTWRALVLVLASVSAGIQGTELVLLREFLRHTSVEVSYSGSSVVEMDSGLPEGGMLGPLCYPLVPSLLDKMLSGAGCGLGVDVPIHALYSQAGTNILDPSSADTISRTEASHGECSHPYHARGR